MGKETNQGYQVSKLIRGDTLRVYLTIVSQRSSKPTSVELLRGYREKDVRLLTAISADILWEPQLRLTFVTLKPDLLQYSYTRSSPTRRYNCFAMYAPRDLITLCWTKVTIQAYYGLPYADGYENRVKNVK